MDKPLSTIRWFLTAVMLLIVALYAASTMSNDPGSYSLSDYLQTLRQGERMRGDKGILEQSVETSQSIIDGLIAGRLSLPQGAIALREELESRPEHLRPHLELYFRNRPEQERYMRQLLIRVGNELQGDPRRDQVLERLGKELE